MAIVEVQIDHNAGAAYIQLSDALVDRTEEVSDNILVDLDTMNVVVGIEVLSLTAQFPIEKLKRDYHIHSDVVVMLQGIRPSVSTFMSSFSSSGGHTKMMTEMAAEEQAPC
ncbi:DUF2283 domain-containing protein [Nocardia sp. NPDC003979]